MSEHRTSGPGGRSGRKLVWVGALLALVALAVASAPLWAGGLAAGLVERRFDADRAGRLEVGRLDLSWTGRQAARDVRLFDPEGAPVAEVTVELPSLVALARGRGQQLGAVTVRATADLVADDAGRSNLERALASTGPEEPPGGGGEDAGGQGGGGLDRLDLEVTLDCPRITWSDARTRELGAPFRISDLRGRAVLRPGQPLSIQLDGDVSSPGGSSAEGGALHVQGELRGLDGGAGALQGDLEAELAGLPTGLVDALAGLDGVLVRTLGERFDLRARAAGGLDEGRVSLEARGAAGGVSFVGELRAGVLTAFGSEEGLELRLQDPTPLLERYAGPALPEGGELAVGGLTLGLREFELPVPDPAAGPLDPAALVSAASARLELELERASLALPELPGGPLELAELRAGARLEPGQPLALTLASRLPAGATAQAGALEVEVELDGLEALIAESTAPAVAAVAAVERAESVPGGTPAGWSARFQGHASGLETARVDAFLGQDGLLVDAIGASAKVTFRGVWPPTAEPFVLELEAPGASLSFTGLLQDGVLVSSGDAPLAARLPLSPLLSKRIVGPLVPLMVHLEKPEGAAPLGLTVTDFHLPLDGDLTRLGATVQLELGQVAYRLVPGLSEALTSLGGDALADVASLPPFELRIEDGLARYDDLKVTIGGHDLHVEGAVNLVTRQLELDVEVPLALLGKDVSRELDKVREYLDPGLSVPIELTGGLERPRVRIGQEFLSRTVKQAAQGAVKKGLFDLLEKELEKKDR